MNRNPDFQYSPAENKEYEGAVSYSKDTLDAFSAHYLNLNIGKPSLKMSVHILAAGTGRLRLRCELVAQWTEGKERFSVGINLGTPDLAQPNNDGKFRLGCLSRTPSSRLHVFIATL